MDPRKRVGESDVAGLVSSYLSGSLGRELSANQRAARAWYGVCLERERNHTCGVFLKEEDDKLPLLVVYLDTNVIMQDFSTNKEIYLLRLESIGFPVSDIHFRLSKFKREQRVEASPTEEGERIPTRELTAEEMREIDDFSSEISSPDLRGIVREAMISSKKWDIAESTQESSKNR